MRAQLAPLDGGPAVEILKDLIVVGRREDCDLRIEHPSVSKVHCVLVKTDGLLFLRDLGSTNGTRVNGVRVRRAALLPNDQISFANFRFQVRLGPQPGAEPVPTLPRTEKLIVFDPAPDTRRPIRDEDSDPPQPAGEHPVPHRNALPDVYPEDGKRK